MLYQLCALALIALVIGLAAVRRCSLYSPLGISASIWLIVFIVGLLSDDIYYPIQENVFISWLIWFMTTSLIFFLLYPSSIKSARIRTYIRRIPVDYSLMLLFLAVWLCYQIWMVGSSGPGDFFSNLRISAVDPDNFTTLGSVIIRSYPLVFALFLFEHVYARRENRNLRLLLWCYMILYAIGNMSKLFILYPTISWIIIQERAGRLNIARISLLAVAVFSLMISVHFIRVGSVIDVQKVLDMLAVYIYILPSLHWVTKISITNCLLVHTRFASSMLLVIFSILHSNRLHPQLLCRFLCQPMYLLLCVIFIMILVN